MKRREFLKAGGVGLAASAVANVLPFSIGSVGFGSAANSAEPLFFDYGANQTPVAGAVLTADGARAVSDAEGRFAVSASPGKLLVEIAAPGFLTVALVTALSADVSRRRLVPRR